MPLKLLTISQKLTNLILKTTVKKAGEQNAETTGK